MRVLAGFLGGLALGLIMGWLGRVPKAEPAQEYDPFALPYGEVVTLNHMLGTETQQASDGTWFTYTSPPVQ